VGTQLEKSGYRLGRVPHLKAWFDKISNRPAVKRGVEVLASLRKPITGDKEREVLFGKTQYEKR
jgi:GST-like protein